MAEISISTRRKLILGGLFAACGYILYKTRMKYQSRYEMKSELTNIITKYLNDVEPIQDPDQRKQFSDDFRAVVLKEFIQRHGVDGASLVCNLLGFPSNDHLGKLVLKMLMEWNVDAYNALVDKVEEIASKKRTVRILELGPGAGFGIETMMQRFGDRIECVDGFEVSECAIRLLEDKFHSDIQLNQMGFHLMDIGNPKHRVTAFEGKYDIIVHMNCFYFWDNLSLCGKRILQLLNDEGHLIGGFYWGYLPDNKKVFKNVHRASYMGMLRDARGFATDSTSIADVADGKETFEIVVVRKEPTCLEL